MARTKMTGGEFKALVPRLRRMTAENVETARRVLVDGIPNVQAASESGLTKQRIGALVKTVLAAAHEVPPHWEHVDVWLPPDLALQVRRMAEEARTRSKSAT